MKIEVWHEQQIAADPQYAAAAKLIEMDELIADTIVSLRVRLELSQSQVAQLAGTTQATISNMENGAANSRLGTVSRVVGALLKEAMRRKPRAGEVMTVFRV